MDPLYQKLTKELDNPIEVIKFEHDDVGEENSQPKIINNLLSQNAASDVTLKRITLKRKDPPKSTDESADRAKREKILHKLNRLQALAAQYEVELYKSQQGEKLQVSKLKQTLNDRLQVGNDTASPGNRINFVEVKMPSYQNSHVEENFVMDGEVDNNLLILESLQTLEDQNKLIIEQNNTIMKQNNKILDLVKNATSTETKLQNTLYQPLEGFPLKTVEEFNDFCNADSDKFQRMHEYLLRLGGTRLREFLSSATKCLMTDELMGKFSWQKGANCEKFGDTKLSNLLFVSAQKCPSFDGPHTLNEYKTEMMEVMRSMKQRYRNLLKKNNEELFVKIASLEQMQQDGQEELSFVVDDDSTEVPEADF